MPERVPDSEDLPPPPLLANFDLIRSAPSADLDMARFPVVFADPAYREHCFKESKRAWLYVYNQERFDTCLKGEKSIEKLRYLKQVRQAGLRLRGAYQFFDSAHACPPQFGAFLYKLGKHNDYYDSPARDGVTRARLEEGDYLDKFGPAEFPFKPTDNESFLKYAENTLREIEGLIDKKNLPAEDFHLLRKKIRLFMNLMQVPAAEQPRGDQQALFYELHLLSHSLGQQHDTIEKGVVSGEINYAEHLVSIDEKTKKRFKRLVPFIKKAVGIASGVES